MDCVYKNVEGWNCSSPDGLADWVITDADHGDDGPRLWPPERTAFCLVHAQFVATFFLTDFAALDKIAIVFDEKHQARRRPDQD